MGSIPRASGAGRGIRRSLLATGLTLLVALVAVIAHSDHLLAQAVPPESKLDPFARLLLAQQPLSPAQALAPATAGGGWTLRSAPPPLPPSALRALGLAPSSGGADAPLQVLVETSASDDELRRLGADVLARVGPVVAVSGSRAAIANLAASARVERIEAARVLETTNDISTVEVGADQAALDFGLDGSGVVVGIIDTGIDFFHQDFRNADGTTRIKALLDASDPISANWTSYTEAQINAELATPGSSVPVRDTNGHGTHVAGTAAGSGARGTTPYAGIAPGADLIVVRSSLIDTSILAGMDFIDDQAALLGEPWVINMSFGDTLGLNAHDGTSLLELAIDSLVGPSIPGQAIVIAAGNSRDFAGHASGTVVASDPTTPVTSEPAITIPAGVTSAAVDFWYDGADLFRFGFRDPSGDGLFASTNPFPLSSSSSTVCADALGGLNCVQVLHSTSTANGDHRILVFVSATGSAQLEPGTWTFELEGTTVSSGRFDGWSAVDEWTSMADPSMRTSIPANAQHVTAVGAYTTRAGFPGQTLGDLTTFSSDGPTRDGRLKPEISAPGSIIHSSHSVSAPAFGSPVNASYTGASGTSMATPHVVGAAALLLQLDPTLSSVQMRDILTATARTDSFTGASLPDNLWGAGKLGVLDAVESIAGTVTLEKVVVNDHGGSAVAGDFTLLIDGNPVTPGVPVPLLAGAHVVSETGLESSYEASFSAACTGGSITLAAGERVTCTITNDDLFGLLRVVTSPALPSQISVNGEPSDDWGLDWVKVPPGEYAVSFSDVKGWGTPPDEVVQVTAGEVATVTGSFVQHGFLRVITSPPVPSTLSVDGAPSNDWGLWTDVPPGTYEVCFGDVADFATPACQFASITAGATTVVTGEFVASPGAPGPTGFGLLRLETVPAVPTQLQLDGRIVTDWGLDWVKLSPGDYSIAYGDVKNFSKPADEVANVAVGGVTVINAPFEENGFIRVITSPPVPGTVYINDIPRDDWGLWTDFPAGGYTVCFGPVPGFLTPACEPITVTAGDLSVVTGVYSAP